MGSIISPGIGSGLDINGLVSQLVAAEGAAESFRLDRREAGLQAELSALGSFRSALDSFNSILEKLSDIDRFQGRSTFSSNDEVFSLVATTDAVPGQYTLQVDALATAQKLASNFFTGSDAVVGTGTLTLTLGTEAFAVAIDAQTNTLAGIRDAINDSPDNSGITATIVNSVDGAHLVLASSKTGAANTVTVTQSGGDGGLSALVYDPVGGTTNLNEVDPAGDARIFIDGLEFRSSNNTVNGAIEGVTLSLLEAQPGVDETLTVDYDFAAARTAVKDFVNNYNAMLTTFKSLTSFDSETLVAGPLLGDSTLRTAADRIRREIGATVDDVNGPFNALFQLGITANVDGTLELDETKLEDAFTQDFDAVGELFSATDGVATRLTGVLEPYVQSEGILDGRTDGIKTSIDDLALRRGQLEQRLLSVEQRLRNQFNALDSLIAQLNGTSTFLSQQLDNLPGARPISGSGS